MAEKNQKTKANQEEELDKKEAEVLNEENLNVSEVEIEQKIISDETETIAKEKVQNDYIDLPECPEGFVCEDYVNEKRKTFDNIMKSSRRSSTLTMVVSVVLLILGFILNTYLDTTLAWISYSIFGVALVVIIVSFVFSSRGKKKIYGSVDTYVKDVIIGVDQYAFDQVGLTQLTVSAKGKAELEDIVDAHYFATINNFNSRNIIKGFYKGKEFSVAELAVRIPYQKPLDKVEGEEEENKPVSRKKKLAGTPTESFGIFGKYFSLPVKVEDDESFILLLRGPNACLPTFLDDYKEITVSDLNASYMCWAKDEAKALKILSDEKMVEILNGFTPNASLENVIISSNSKGLKVCLNYNETVMEIPMQKGVEGKPYETYKNDVRRVLDVVDCLSK
jgi:hypothetical protein